MNQSTNEELQDLIKKATAGDKTSLETVMRSVQDLVFNLSLRMLGTFPDAEDASQDILLKVITHLSSFKGKSSFSTWVFRIAVNHLKNYKKHMFAQTVLYQCDAAMSGHREQMHFHSGNHVSGGQPDCRGYSGNHPGGLPETPVKSAQKDGRVPDRILRRIRERKMPLCGPSELCHKKPSDNSLSALLSDCGTGQYNAGCENGHGRN